MIKYTRFIGIVLVLIGSIVTIGLSQEENINITTYYPSPAGSYDNITVSNMATINNMILTNEGSLYYADGFSVPPYTPAVPTAATTTIGNANTISTEAFRASNYYSPIVHARTLVADTSVAPWKIPTWEVSDWKILPSFGHEIELSCSDGFINAVKNLSFTEPPPCICVPIPTPIGVIWVAACLPMDELMAMNRKCIYQSN